MNDEKTLLEEFLIESNFPPNLKKRIYRDIKITKKSNKYLPQIKNTAKFEETLSKQKLKALLFSNEYSMKNFTYITSEPYDQKKSTFLLWRTNPHTQNKDYLLYHVTADGKLKNSWYPITLPQALTKISIEESKKIHAWSTNHVGMSSSKSENTVYDLIKKESKKYSNPAEKIIKKWYIEEIVQKNVNKVISRLAVTTPMSLANSIKDLGNFVDSYTSSGKVERAEYKHQNLISEKYISSKIQKALIDKTSYSEEKFKELNENDFNKIIIDVIKDLKTEIKENL